MIQTARRTTLALATALAVLLGGCWPQTGATPTPQEPVESTPVATPTVSETPVATPSTTPAAPSKSPTPSPQPPKPVPTTKPPSTLRILLGGRGINFWTLDKANKKEVLPELEKNLGKPDSIDEANCELSGDFRTAYSWKGLTIQFTTSTGVLRHWFYIPKEGLPGSVELGAHLPENPTYTHMRSVYPHSKPVDVWGGNGGLWSITVNEVTFFWDTDGPEPKGTEKPSMVHAINPNWCE